MDLHYAIPYTIAATGSVFLALIPFVGRYRDASPWLRIGMLVAAAVCIAWSILGFYLLAHTIGGKTSLPWSRFWALDHMKSNLTGFALGILLSLVLSPEFRSYRRRKQRV